MELGLKNKNVVITGGTRGIGFATAKELFAQEVLLDEADHAVAHFHACPLVEAWREYGLSAERIRYLCDLASKGDFGRASNFPNIEISFPKKIAYGDEVCELDVKTVK